MAYLGQTIEDENKNKVQGQDQESHTNEQVLGGASTQIGGDAKAGGAPTSPGTAPAPSKSGAFTNLNSYLDANKGNDGAMGQAVQANTDKTISEIGGNASRFADNTNQKVQAATVKDKGVIAGLASNPIDVKKTDFDNQYNATYAGPKDVTAEEGYSDINQSHSRLSNMGNSLNDFSGRQEVLKNTYNHPKYSQGEQQLDSFILGGGEQGQQSIRNIQSNIGNANTGWANTLATLGQNIQGAQQATEDTKLATRNAATAAQKSALSAVDAAKNAAGKENYDRNKAEFELKRDLDMPGSWRHNSAVKTLNKMGVSAELIQYATDNNIPLSSLVKGGTQVAVGDKISAADASRYNAIQALLGEKGDSFDKNANISGTGIDSTVLGNVQAGLADKKAKDAAGAKVAAELQAEKERLAAEQRAQAEAETARREAAARDAAEKRAEATNALTVLSPASRLALEMEKERSRGNHTFNPNKVTKAVASPVVNTLDKSFNAIKKFAGV